MTKIFIFLLLLIGFGIPTSNFLSIGTKYLSLLPVLIGIFSIIALKFRWTWLSNIIFILGITTVALVRFFLLNPVIMILSAVFILSTWDLTHLQHLLNRINPTKRVTQVEKVHL